MNLAYRKLALLEKDLLAKEEKARIEGLYVSPIDNDFKNRISDLLDKVRYL